MNNKFFQNLLSLNAYRQYFTIIIYNSDPCDTGVTQWCAIGSILQNDIEIAIILKLIVIDDVKSYSLSVLCVFESLKNKRIIVINKRKIIVTFYTNPNYLTLILHDNTNQHTGLVLEVLASFAWPLPGLKLHTDCSLKNLLHVVLVRRVGSGRDRSHLGGTIFESHCVSIL